MLSSTLYLAPSCVGLYMHELSALSVCTGYIVVDAFEVVNAYESATLTWSLTGCVSVYDCI